MSMLCLKISGIGEKQMHRLLRALGPETAHNIGKFYMLRGWWAPGPVIRPQYLFGKVIVNPLGLAAGFDKNGELVDVVQNYGFGYVEVGSVTWEGGLGNPKPRMFRTKFGILNRMGLNGDPAYKVAARLGKARAANSYSVNIAATKGVTGDAAIADIYNTYKLLCNLGLYTVININCPNSEARTFEDPSCLRELLAALRNVRGLGTRPLLVKISPLCRMDKVIDTCEEFGIAGYVCCNTFPYTDRKYGKGGLSGAVLRAYVYNQLAYLKRNIPDRVRIACGGISNTWMNYDAHLYQAYSGFVTHGVGFAAAVLKNLGG